jgi:LPS export ABC transporter protein LptC
MSLSRLRIIVVTLLLTLVALWLTSPNKNSSSEQADSDIKNTAFSWKASNTTLWQVTPNQTNKQTVIQAESFTYAEDIKQGQFIKPTATIIQDNVVNQLRSENGQSWYDSLIIFENNVVLTQTQNNSKAPSNLYSERLLYNSETQKLTSNREVLMTQENNQTRGVGLIADLNTQDFFLQSQVECTFYPTTQNEQSAHE